MVAKPPTKQLSPAMAQFHRWKTEYPDEVLFFRMGDFFEMFYDDAKVVSEALGLTLTSRSKGESAIPMAGVPVRSVDQYLQKLVSLGHRVAICDQIQDPKDATGVVDRAVTRIVTAGTLTEEGLLDRTVPNYLAAVHVAPGGDRCGLAFVDLSTGSFLVEELAPADAADSLLRHGSAEILIAESSRDGAVAAELTQLGRGAALTKRPDWQFESESALESLRDQFRVRDTDGFGLEEDSPAVVAAGAVLRYLTDTQKTELDHLDPPRQEIETDRLLLDRATRSCLELTETAREGRKSGSVLSVLDQTVTAMGARRLREWLLQPMRDVDEIRGRQAAVAELVADTGLRAKLRDSLKPVADIERLLTRVVTNRANARDLVQLRGSLAALPGLIDLLAETQAARLITARDGVDPQPELRELLERAVLDEPPLTLRDGGIIADGFHSELDELRAIHRDGRQYILGYQTDEIERTGIQNLKVGYNRVFGYYIEITNSWKDRVPEEYVRKQTLKNAERYITPQLKEYESKVLSADDRAKELEFELFLELRDQVLERTQPLKETAADLADLDTLLSLSEVAALHGYARPEVDDSTELVIEEGRHPVLAATLGSSAFVPNDCRIGDKLRRLAIVTGPNMAGKSTYIRQVALIQILAQMGGFVPAKNARVGVADRVFARVGASDDLARGHSTFMVEMTETANILNNATERSLVILDEVGRGTSTFDGMSLAWAISEHLLNKTRTRALFATHYHQLIDLANTYPGVVNLNVAVREWGEEIVFLHQIVEGGSDRSYGIHVARLAGIPRSVLERAETLLRELEESSPEWRAAGNAAAKGSGDEGPAPKAPTQQTLFESPEKGLLKELRKLDPDQLTPLDALVRLKEWKDRFGG